MKTSAFVEAVQQNRSPAVDVNDGLAAVAIGVAAEMSIKEKHVIQIDEIMHAFSPATYEGNDGEKSTESAEKRRKLSPKASWSTA